MATRVERDFLRYRRRGDGEALARVFDTLAPQLLLLAAHVAQDRAQAKGRVQETLETGSRSTRRAYRVPSGSRSGECRVCLPSTA